MSESNQHQNLVKKIIEDITNIVGEESCCFIESDISDGQPLPSLTPEGFRPDVQFQYLDLLIVGEAKTSKDVDREHSLLQYDSYIKKCSLFDGKAIFILAVPWIEYATAHNITKKIQEKYPGNYSIKIIKGLGI